MANYTFLLQHNPSPVDFPRFCQPGFFFNEHPHLSRQGQGDFYVLSAVNQETRLADARCAFFLTSGSAHSPLAAPFGSVEFSEFLTDAVLDAFIHELIESVRHTGADELRLVHYPTCYAPQQTERLTSVLAKHQFSVTEQFPTFFLPVADEPCTAQLVPAERRRLRKCREAGFQFAEWPSTNVGKIIDFIQHTRQLLAYRLTLSPDLLRSLLTEFSDTFSVFTVTDASILAALVVTVRVRHDILYTFLPASHPAYHRFSPIVMLIDELLTYCRQQRIRLLDLGVSVDGNRQPKPNLMRFKRNLGALESPKFTFQKAL